MHRRFGPSPISIVFAFSSLSSIFTNSVAADFTGTVTSLARDSICVQSQPPPPNMKAPLLLARIDLIQTIVTIDDVNDAGVFESTATLADVHRGQQVTISVNADLATRIHVRQPLMLSGFVRQVSRDAIEVRSAGPGGAAETLHRFSVDPLHLRVKGALFNHGPELQLGTKDVVEGQAVTILNARGHAYVVEVIPPAPLMGAILTIAPPELTVRTRSRRPAILPADHTFYLARSTRYFNEYFGEPPEEVTAADVKSGQVVSVTASGPLVVAVVAVFPAVAGKVVKVDAGNLTIKRGNDNDPNPFIRQYQVSVTSKIFMGVARFTQPSARGGAQTFYDYLPGGKISDIKVGDRVSITAKRDLALSMRVTPMAKQAVAAPSK